MSSVGLELPGLLEQLVAKRERYRAAAQTSDRPDCFAPAIALMTRDIEAAKEAMAENNVVKCLLAYDALQGWSYED